MGGGGGVALREEGHGEAGGRQLGCFCVDVCVSVTLLVVVVVQHPPHHTSSTHPPSDGPSAEKAPRVKSPGWRRSNARPHWYLARKANTPPTYIFCLRVCVCFFGGGRFRLGFWIIKMGGHFMNEPGKQARTLGTTKTRSLTSATTAAQKAEGTVKKAA